jgi:hypothetical protein
MICNLQPDCEWDQGHDVPCGKVHIPGSPCAYCSKPTPLSGDPCPDCWISLTDKPMADIKALLAGVDLSADPTPSDD